MKMRFPALCAAMLLVGAFAYADTGSKLTNNPPNTSLNIDSPQAATALHLDSPNPLTAIAPNALLDKDNVLGSSNPLNAPNPDYDHGNAPIVNSSDNGRANIENGALTDNTANNSPPNNHDTMVANGTNRKDTVGYTKAKGSCDNVTNAIDTGRTKLNGNAIPANGTMGSNSGYNVSATNHGRSAVLLEFAAMNGSTIPNSSGLDDHPLLF